MYGVRTVTVTIPLSAEGIYGYIRRLRDGRGYTQQELADLVGVKYRTYVDYENRETKELKQSTLVRAVLVLGGSWAHIEKIITDDADEEQGRQLAEEILSPQYQAAVDPFLAADASTRALLREVYEASQNPMLRERIKAYLDGLTDQLDLSGVPLDGRRRKKSGRKPQS